MVAKGTFYGVVTLLTCGVVVASTLAASFYVQYQDQAAQRQTYVDELNVALARADGLANSYGASLSDFNQTLTLLAGSVMDMNRSSPTYEAVSGALPSLWAAYLALPSANQTAPVYAAGIKVDYCNGAGRWYNSSRIQAGWNGYIATAYLLHGKVDATWYPQFGEHFVTAINGVSGNSTTSWFVWVWEDNHWSYSDSLGIDLVPVHNGTLLAWTLSGYDLFYRPTCTP